jgi:hypothetical protein
MKNLINYIEDFEIKTYIERQKWNGQDYGDGVAIEGSLEDYESLKNQYAQTEGKYKVIVYRQDVGNPDNYEYIDEFVTDNANIIYEIYI